MTTPKILGQVTSCGECPNHVYYSGGAYQCRLVDEIVRDKTIIAPFCPLPDFPARVIADMQVTILALRDPKKYGFGLSLLTYVASKLGLNLHANGMGLVIPFKDGDKDREVYLGLHYITGVSVLGSEITFTNQLGKFRLIPDANPPLLSEQADAERDLWRQHYLR